MPLIFDLSQQLEDAQLKGNLQLRTEYGNRWSIPVEIIGYKEHSYIFVRPFSTKDTIIKGMSGGLLVVNGIAAGILTEVNPDSGVGTVVRQDFLYGLLRFLLEDHTSIGKVEKLIGEYVVIELFREVPVGTKIYALTQSGRKIMLRILKVHLNYSSAQFLNETYTLGKGEFIYELKKDN